MQDVRVNKEALLDILKSNKATHTATVAAAREAFRDRVIATLDTHLGMARSNKPLGQEILHINLPVPEDHTDDYTKVIRMLELSLDDEIMLSDYDHARLVMDEWDWGRSFTANTTSYLQK